MDHDHELLTVAEVATHLRVSKMSVYRLIGAGHLESIQVGRAYRIKRASLNAFLTQGGVRR